MHQSDITLPCDFWHTVGICHQAQQPNNRRHFPLSFSGMRVFQMMQDFCATDVGLPAGGLLNKHFFMCHAKDNPETIVCWPDVVNIFVFSGKHSNVLELWLVLVVLVVKWPIQRSPMPSEMRNSGLGMSTEYGVKMEDENQSSLAQWYRWDFSSHAMGTESWQKERHNLLQLKYTSDLLLPLAGGWSSTIFTQSLCADGPGVVDTNTAPSKRHVCFSIVPLFK